MRGADEARLAVRMKKTAFDSGKREIYMSGYMVLSGFPRSIFFLQPDGLWK